MLDCTKGFFSDKSINTPSRSVASPALRTQTKTNNTEVNENKAKKSL